MKYKYLVTGGAGFIGSNLVEKLLKDGHFVRIVDNLSTGNLKNVQEFLSNHNLEFIKGDICDLGLVRRVVKKIDYILHLAAIPSVPYSIKHPDETNNVNIVGTMNLLVAARKEGIKKFVYSSSSAVYGNNKNGRVLPTQEHDAIDPISPYALQKFASERYCRFFSDFYHFPTLALRYFNVFGPKQNPRSQYSAAIPRF
ncbi:MAG: NAD-dependent epimerase/dehydratase family protein, partial [Patescibacteria group bacterium]